MPRSRLLQALPYALEDQLTDDIEDLHFASGEHQADGNLPVAVISKKTMEFYLELLASWQIKPDIMLPAILALPWESDHWQIAIGNLSLVRTGLNQGFACDTFNLKEYVALALSSQIQPPGQIHIANCTDQASPSLEISGITIKENHYPAAQWLSDSAHAIAMQQNILNLLQGDYGVKQSGFKQIRGPMRIIAYLAAAWLILLFLYPMGSYIILKRQSDDLSQQINLVYKKQFPNVKKVTAAKRRMEDKLQRLHAQVGENKLLLILAYIGKSLSDTRGVSIQQYDYQDGQLTMNVKAVNSDSVSHFMDALSGFGLQVKQQNANLTGEQVTATLQIEVLE